MTHCVACSAPFKRNTQLALTPVGRTVAFDASRGRVWIVCDACGGWNLTSIDGRLEAIDECERVFEQTPVKDTTGRVSRGALPGLQLIAIGEHAGRELALWRYCGRVMRRDRIRHAVGGSIMVAMTAGAGALGMWLSPVAAGSAWAGGMLSLWLLGAWNGSVVRLELRDDRGRLRRLTRRDLATAMLVRDSDAPGWRIRLHSNDGSLRFVGEAALLVLRAALPLGMQAVTPEQLQEALAFLANPRFVAIGDVFAALSEPETARPRRAAPANVSRAGTVHRLPLYQRIALEIAATDLLERDTKSDGMERILGDLENAEVIAEIADNLLLPDDVVRAFERMREGK